MLSYIIKFWGLEVDFQSYLDVDSALLALFLFFCFNLDNTFSCMHACLVMRFEGRKLKCLL